MEESGGYTRAEITLTEGENLFIAVGGRGGDGLQNPTAPGGWNGGGNGSIATPHRGGGGGGATHIARTTNRGVLENYNSFRSEVLVVAGGGRWRRKSINRRKWRRNKRNSTSYHNAVLGQDCRPEEEHRLEEEFLKSQYQLLQDLDAGGETTVNLAGGGGRWLVWRRNRS